MRKIIIFRTIVPLQADIAVDIEIPVFRYSLFVKFHAEILNMKPIGNRYAWFSCFPSILDRNGTRTIDVDFN